MDNNIVRNQSEDPAQTIVFDTSSGISMEEQQEILAGINAMAIGSRVVPRAAATKAKKRGLMFPLFVNIGAVVFLALGLVLLFLFHSQDEQHIRESSATLGITERLLIQEIRQETSRQIGEKEREINDIISMLSAAETEYRALQGSVESLTEAQEQRAAALLQMQEEYRQMLFGLEEERAAILENSRLQEAALRVQAEQSRASLGQAMDELGRLGAEQERLARVEAQMSGYYALGTELISEGRLDEAAAALVQMREFLDAPSFQGMRSFDARRQSHLSAIAAMEGALTGARRLRDAASPGAVAALPTGQDDAAVAEAVADLQARYAALEQQLEAQTLLIAASGATGSEQNRIIEEYANHISRLQALETNQRDTISRQESEILEVNSRAQQAENALAEQQRENSSLAAERDEILGERDRLQDLLTTLRAALDN